MLVTVIVPLRDSGAHINGLLESLTQQDYRQVEILLVGNTGDTTWAQIEPKYRGKYRTLEVNIPPNWVGRDTNVKRNMGARAARGQVLFFTDVKIRHPKDWISRGLQIMEEQEVESVAGIMLATKGSLGFLGHFTDSALIKRNPDFGKGFFLNKKNFGNRESLPITATWAMTKDFYALGEFPEDFRDSYEDYAAAWIFTNAGGTIFCSSSWAVYHKHRTKFTAIRREYARSARGAAQLWHTFPACPYGKRRATQVVAVFMATIATLIFLAALIATGNWVLLQATLATGGVGYTTLGVLNTLKARYLLAFFFPLLTVYFIYIFSINFVRKLLEGGGVTKSNSFLQLILPF